MDFGGAFAGGFQGGYSPSQPSSQPAQASMTPSPKKTATDKPEAHGVLPLTAKAYLQHVDSVEKDTITIYGLGATKVVFVGIVKGCEVKTTNHSVLIDDHTGQVRAQNFQQNRKEVSAGDIVRIVAQPRPKAGGEAIVSVINLSVIPEGEAAEAIGFHLIQSCLAQCEASAKGVPMEDLTPEKQEAQTARAGAEKTASPERPAGGAELAGGDLEQAILEALRGFPSADDGYSITRITDALAKSAKPSAVKEMIEKMEGDGSLFTVDEGRVQLTEG